MTPPSVPRSASSHERNSRGLTFGHSGLLAALLLLIAAIALPASQAPPPAIAELAPNAQEQITDAPIDQSSDFGQGDGGPGGGGATTTTSTTSTTTAASADGKIDRGRVRQCVGNPPRQTEDFHSPPCVNFFEGNNGGATSRGVTGDEIVVAVPVNNKFASLYTAYFNSRYEFYGRKLVIKAVSGGGSPQGMVSLAVKVDKEVGAFASTTIGDNGGGEYVYYDELAKRGIVSTNGYPSAASEAHLASRHPYEWSYLPTFDFMGRSKAEWVCKALKGKLAEFAGGAERAQTRKFALVSSINLDGSGPDLAPIVSTLGNCGIDVRKDTYEIVRQQGDDAAGIQQAQDIVLKLQTAGVTTVICECHTQSSGLYLYPVATKQGYYPEWVFATYMYQAEDIHVQLWDGAQMAHTFGLSWWNKQLTYQESPWYWALRDVDPNFTWSNEPFDYYDARWLFNSFSLLAAGIQLAGPKLTPASFAAGLQRARFPNPNPGQPPYWQARVGFAGDHTFINDASLVWADKSQPSTWANVPGTLCYGNGGRRYTLGEWPTDYGGIYAPASCN